MTSEHRFNADYTAKMQGRNMTELLAALLEQQRIANLIAWYGDEDIPDAVADQIREGLGL